MFTTCELFGACLVWEVLPLNVAEASAIVREYGQRQTVRETTQLAMDIVSQYGAQAILGEITPEEAVAKMQQELQAKEYISCQ